MKANKSRKKKKEVKQQLAKPVHMFASSAEYIDYAYGDDPIMCQALKNCCEED